MPKMQEIKIMKSLGSYNYYSQQEGLREASKEKSVTYSSRSIHIDR